MFPKSMKKKNMCGIKANIAKVLFVVCALVFVSCSGGDTKDEQTDDQSTIIDDSKYSQPVLKTLGAADSGYKQGSTLAWL